MEAIIFTNVIILSALAIGTYTDIKTREVPDWLNYTLIGSGIVIWLLNSIIFYEWKFLLYSLLGLFASTIIGLGMFYTGQWGGGDSKMVMGLGALIGFNISFQSLLVGFIVNALIAGALYGFIWSSVLAIRNRKSFIKELKNLFGKRNIKNAKWFIISAVLLFFLMLFFIKDDFLRLTLAGLVLAIALTFYLWLFVKAIENACMFKRITPDKLTEGDWIAKPVMHHGKTICGPKDLGIEKKQIALLKRLGIKNVLVKEGIPFVPSFLIAYLLGLYLLHFFPETAGNILFLLF